jgi:hypothetical protein
MIEIPRITGTLPTVEPEITDGSRGGYGGWIVTVYNNNHNTWEEVMSILQAATGCGPEEAYLETWEVDNLGASVVHHGREQECQDAAAIIATIGIRVEVTEE